MESGTKSFGELKYDTKESTREKIAILRKGEKSKKMIDVNYRLTQLKKLRAAFVKYEKDVNQSNLNDMGVSEFMSFYTSYSLVKQELDSVIDSIWEWTAPRSVNTPAILAPAKSYIIPEPFGVCLVMSAWNSQYLTLIMPIAQALAAGNVILAKPSEMAPDSAIVCEKILRELDEEVVQVCHGGAEVCEELLKNKFDIILFTGSPQKGVLVSKAAAEFLTPCILELGGQNPVIVDKSANLQNCAYNLVNGRCIFAGQACIAPEYAFVEKEIYEKLITQLKSTVETFYNKDAKKSLDYSRIINDWHAGRLAKLIDTHGGKLITGGNYDVKEKYIEPTIVAYDSIEEMGKSPLACSEIFGPILYIAPYSNLDDCINYINAKDKPLTLYYFGSNKRNKEKIIKNTSSGGFVANDCLVHFTNLDLPFGGVGSSGYSAYHGISGFNNLSHLKAVMDRSEFLVKVRYPPFDNNKQKIMRFLLNKVTFSQHAMLKFFLYTALLITMFYLRNCYSGLVDLNKYFKK
jgi:aldehyde dehydrogenase (NAD+)